MKKISLLDHGCIIINCMIHNLYFSSVCDIIPQALIEEFEQKLHKCHNKGLDSFTEAPQELTHPEGSNTPVLRPIKKVASRMSVFYPNTS